MKKLTPYIAILAVFFLPVAVYADASSSIQLPSNFTANIWAQAQDLFNGTQSYVTLIVGTILATIVIEILIGALKKPGS